MKNSLKLMLLPILAIFFFSGCGPAVRMASLQMDNNAKKFMLHKDYSSLYIYRNETFGFAIGMPVAVDGKLLGKTGAQTYFNVKLSPGKHKIESLTENTSVLVLDTVPGKNYYVWQEVKMGMWAARSLLQEVTKDVGQKGVMECKLLEPEAKDF